MDAGCARGPVFQGNPPTRPGPPGGCTPWTPAQSCRVLGQPTPAPRRRRRTRRAGAYGARVSGPVRARGALRLVECLVLGFASSSAVVSGCWLMDAGCARGLVFQGNPPTHPGPPGGCTPWTPPRAAGSADAAARRVAVWRMRCVRGGPVTDRAVRFASMGVLALGLGASGIGVAGVLADGRGLRPRR